MVRNVFNALTFAVVAGVVAGGFVGATAAPSVAAAPKVGGVCKRVGDRTGPAAAPLVCTKTAKGLRLVAVKKASGTTTTPTTTNTPNTTTTKLAANPVAAGPSTSAVPASNSSTSTTSPASSASGAAKTSATTRTGVLSGDGSYRAAGTVELAVDGGRATLRFVGSSIQDGPALSVWLTPRGGSPSTTGAVRIGPLTSLTGSHSYDVRADVDVAAFSGVLIWCDRFSVPFGTAALS